jgi:hypothetical protein
MNHPRPSFPSEHQPVNFSTWKTALAQSGLPVDRRDEFRYAIFAFLRHCKDVRAVATVALARHYLAGTAASAPPAPVAREALRWFFRAAQTVTDGGRRTEDEKAERLKAEGLKSDDEGRNAS